LSQISDFKNIEYTKYTKGYQYKNEITQGNITGYFKVKLTIFNHIKIHPFAYIDENGLPIYPIGTFETYLVLEEILAIYKYKVGIVEIIDGWYCRFLNRGKPMLNIVNKLFDKRELGKIENDLAKGILVGYVGKMNAQFDDDKTSNTYNPLIPAWIYAKARIQVMDFIYQNQLTEDAVAVSTDGVISLKEASKTPIATKRIIGTWRLNSSVPALVLSPGWIIYKNKHPHSINYDTAINLIKKKPNDSHYKATVKQRVTLFEALEVIKDIKQVGNITDHYNSIDLVEIQMSQDRIFPQFPTTGKALLTGKIYNSQPITLDS
jgi:hypothetical protein